MNFITLYYLLLACIHVYAQRCKVIECRYWRLDVLPIDKVDPTLCTHLTYGSPNLLEKIVYPDSQHAKEEMQYFAQLRALKKRNPQLKILLSIEPDFMDNFFYIMYKNSTLRSHFIEKTIRFIRQIDFDGTEFYLKEHVFEYRKNDKLSDGYFVTLLKEFSEAYTAERLKSNKSKLILTTIASPDVNLYYDMVDVLRYLDYMIVDTVKLYIAFRHHTPLYGADKNDSQSLDYFTRYLVNKGYVKQKLVLVLHMSGNRYLKGMFGDLNKYDPYGMLDFKEVCELSKNKIPLFDEVGMFSYYQTIEEGIFYNSQLSMQIKVIYVKMHGLGGISLSLLHRDDYTGACKKGKFPLTNAAVYECRIG